MRDLFESACGLSRVVGLSRDDARAVADRGGGRVVVGSAVPVWRSTLALGLLRHHFVSVYQSSQYEHFGSNSSVQCLHARTL